MAPASAATEVVSDHTRRRASADPRSRCDTAGAIPARRDDGHANCGRRSHLAQLPKPVADPLAHGPAPAHQPLIVGSFTSNTFRLLLAGDVCFWYFLVGVSSLGFCFLENPPQDTDAPLYFLPDPQRIRVYTPSEYNSMGEMYTPS